LVGQLAVVPHFDAAAVGTPGSKLQRSVLLAPSDTPVAGLPERTALIRDPGGNWRQAGEGSVVVYLNGTPTEPGLEALAR
jgi:hypothetical protein